MSYARICYIVPISFLRVVLFCLLCVLMCTVLGEHASLMILATVTKRLYYCQCRTNYLTHFCVGHHSVKLSTVAYVNKKLLYSVVFIEEGTFIL